MMMFGQGVMATTTIPAPLTLPLTGMRAGYDARDLSPGAVAAWADISGHSRNASQSDPALQPGYEASVASLNGQAAAVFDGVKRLTLNSINVGAAAGFTAYWVADFGGANAVTASTPFYGGQTQLSVASGHSAASPSVYLDTTRVLGYPADSMAGPACWTWTTGLSPAAYVDRVRTGTATVPAQKGLNASPTTMGHTNNAVAKVAAFFIYDGIHDATQRAAVWDYIYQEWRVAPRQNTGSDTPTAYDTVILAGQSNARGNALLSSLASPYEESYPGVMFYNSTPSDHRSRVWGPLAPVTSSAGYGFGCEVSLGRDLDADAGWPNVAIYKCAQGSTSLVTDWNPAGPGTKWSEITDVYDRAVSALPNAGDSLNVRAFIWIHGESDTIVQAHSLAYEANLTAFIAAVRTKWGAGLPVWIVRLTTPNSFGAYEDNVIAAQNAVAAADPDVYIIAPTSPLPDGVHFSAAALVQLGQHLAADIIAEGV